MSIALWNLAKETARKVEALEKGMTPSEAFDVKLVDEISRDLQKLEEKVKLLGQQYTALNARVSKALKKEAPNEDIQS